MARYAMIIDLKKCIGCQTCTIACKVENFTRPGIFWNLVKDEEAGTYPSVKRRFVPRICMHCQKPSCVDVCPTGASYQRADGIVLVDYSKCIGCRSCLVACPYGARYFNKETAGYYGEQLTAYEEIGYQEHVRGVAEKCTFCSDRVDQGAEPACVRACPANARIFGDLHDKSTRISELLRSRQTIRLAMKLGTEPSVYYLPA